MRNKNKKCRILLATIAGALMIPGNAVMAADVDTNADQSRNAVVLADVLNVRQGTDTSKTILTQICYNEQYPVTGEAVNGWYPVQVGDISGWVSGEYVEIETHVSDDGQAVIDYACQFIGNPYVWGGTSLTEGADCSGFVQSVYAHFGVSLPRTTWDMETAGMEVSYEQALPGDLVLYDGHVGLYMGEDKIVNAMNEEDGIGICSAVYAPIVTVRRVI